MEGFFRELHHFVTFTPSVERKVDERTRHLIDNWRTPKGRGIDTQMIEYERHGIRHHLLLRIGCAEGGELLTPLVDLVSKVDFHWTKRLAREAERTGREVSAMFLRVAQHTEIDTDRTWNEIAIRIASTTTIDRASVHATATTNALERFPVFWISNPFAASIIYEDDMHRGCRRTRLAEMTRIGSSRLSRSSTAEHALKYCQTIIIWYHFLESNGSNVKLRTGSAHVGISLVGTNYDITRFSYSEIASCHTRISSEKLIAEGKTCHIGEIRWVVITLLRTKFFTGKSEEIFPAWCAAHPEETPDVIVLDPPRKGCDAALLEALKACRPEKIVYVSCNSATLARDLKILADGYLLDRVCPVDMFPQGIHCGVAVSLSRAGSKR